MEHENIIRHSYFLGIIGFFSSFELLYIGRELLHLSTETFQSFIYLKLSVAGHFASFVARTKGPFWSVKPAKILLLTVMLTS
jgi:H+-transporting ATPase